MRRLTVKREKTFVGCLGKMKLFIEDKDGDQVLCEKSCRQLGVLKNGEEATFEIGEDAAEIFVIADRVSKDYCYDRYKLPAGREDVLLAGRNIFNPLLGNPFCFNGNELKPEDRKINVKKLVAIILCSALVGLAIGFGLTEGVYALLGLQEESFDTGEMTIRLNQNFAEQIIPGYEGVFVSRDVDVIIIKNSFDEVKSSSMTATEYARALLADQRVFDSECVTKGSLTSFIYTAEAKDGKEYRYHLYAFKTDDAYWHIYFVIRESRADLYANKVSEWAESVVFE